jgi:hypothetical protein
LFLFGEPLVIAPAMLTIVLLAAGVTLQAPTGAPKPCHPASRLRLDPPNINRGVAMKRLRTGALVSAAALLVAIAAAACGNDNAKSEGSAPQASIDQLAARVQQDQMLNSLITLAGLPLHEMDSTAQGGKIDNKYVPTARMLVRVTALTDWGAELATPAQKLHDDSVKLLQALDAGDVATIAAVTGHSRGLAHVHRRRGTSWRKRFRRMPADRGDAGTRFIRQLHPQDA